MLDRLRAAKPRFRDAELVQNIYSLLARWRLFEGA
jgi:hypothetical protein